jgi:hypothetical protein
MSGKGVEWNQEHHSSFFAGSSFHPGGSNRAGGIGVKGIGRRSPAWSDPIERSNKTEQEKGKRGTSRRDSFTKMKSMREGLEVVNRQDIAFSGTVEMNLLSSIHCSRVAAQGEVCFPPGPQVSKCMLKSLPSMIGIE